jgi:hypothetical protein
LSPPRLGRGAKPASSRSSSSGSRSIPARGGARGVYVQSPKSDIYVAMLGIALGAIVLGCLLLIILMGRYEFQMKPTALETRSAPAALAVALDRAPAFDRIGLRA